MAGITSFLEKDIGGLPGGLWLGVGVLALGIGFVVSRRSSGSSQDTTGSGGGGVGNTYETIINPPSNVSNSAQQSAALAINNVPPQSIGFNGGPVIVPSPSVRGERASLSVSARPGARPLSSTGLGTVPPIRVYEPIVAQPPLPRTVPPYGIGTGKNLTTVPPIVRGAPHVVPPVQRQQQLHTVPPGQVRRT